PAFSAHVRLRAANPTNTARTYVKPGWSARKSLRASLAVDTFASHDAASRKPTIFEKLKADPPRCGRTSRKAMTANRHRPTLGSPTTSTTNARPIAAATPTLGSTPA